MIWFGETFWPENGFNQNGIYGNYYGNNSYGYFLLVPLKTNLWDRLVLKHTGDLDTPRNLEPITQEELTALAQVDQNLVSWTTVEGFDYEMTIPFTPKSNTNTQNLIFKSIIEINSDIGNEKFKIFPEFIKKELHNLDYAAENEPRKHTQYWEHLESLDFAIILPLTLHIESSTTQTGRNTGKKISIYT
jgi:hypothetical protein